MIIKKRHVEKVNRNVKRTSGEECKVSKELVGKSTNLGTCIMYICIV